MKLFILAAAATLALSAGDLKELKTVYLLPMSNGLDQYLATQLTQGGVMVVVTDPQKADAVLTDKIGKSFEERLDDLYGKTSKTEEQTQGMQPVSRGHGSIFLVDRHSRDVVWSTYEEVKTALPNDLNRTADKIVKKLEKARTPKSN